MIPTPDLSHIPKEYYEDVYEPAEDTFLLLDALEQDAESLRSMRPLISLEIGYDSIFTWHMRAKERTGLDRKLGLGLGAFLPFSGRSWREENVVCTSLVK